MMAAGTPSPDDSAHNTPTPTTQSDEISNSAPSAPSDFLTHLPSSANIPFADAETPPPSAPDAGDVSAAAPPKTQYDSHGHALNPRSCVTCRKRKVKCDKVHPCSNCNRAHIECVFPAPGRAPRKVRKLGEGRDKELLDRLRRLEGVVKGMGVEVPRDEKESNSGPASRASLEPRPQGDGAEMSPDSIGVSATTTAPTGGNDDIDHKNKVKWVEERQDRNFENRFGRLVVNEGKSRYINNSFWANLSNEVEDLKGILNQTSDDEDNVDSPAASQQLGDNHQGWVFGFSSQNVDLLPLHPLPSQIRTYWETYKDRVDPLVKVLHIPSIEPKILNAASNLSGLSRGFEAFLFAIYYGATTSLSAADCVQKFGEEKSVLLARYRFGIQQALARANFLTSEEIVVLQAFVVFLICLRRNNDARVIWTLTGLVVRIAQTIGVHRDGSHFGLAPFEVEMRRRLWWQVCILDTRASEDHGCDPTIIEQAFDTKMPLNVNDCDISPDMKDFPPERQGCTDMSFCLIRFEVANTFRRINYIPPGPPKACSEYFANVTLQDKEKWITECHHRLEERYLKHCDMTVPLFWVTATVARLMMSKMWLMVYHPFQRHDGGASLPQETKEKLFITSLENIEYSLLLETESRTMKWGWLFKTYMQWHALAFILSELCHKTTGDLVERAWTAVDKTCDGRWGIHVTADSPTGHLWRPLKKLYRKAAEARRRGLQQEMIAKQRSTVAPLPAYSPVAVGGPFDRPNQSPPVPTAAAQTAPTRQVSNGLDFKQLPSEKQKLFLPANSVKPTTELNPNAMDVSDQPTTDQIVQQPLPSRRDPPLQQRAQQPFPTQQQQQQRPTIQDSVMSTGVPLQSGPQFGANFFVNTGASNMAATQIDFSNMSQSPLPLNMSNPNLATLNNQNGMPAAAHNGQMRVPSYDSNGWDPAEPSDMSGAMDTSGDMNWENWEQLVKQFGMNDPRSNSDGMPADWAGGGNWDALANGGNMRMGMNMNMGMGGGDWF